MFSKQEQWSWMKIEYARGRTVRQCHKGLQEACGESSLPYRTVARWIHAFNECRQIVADMHRAGSTGDSKKMFKCLYSLWDLTTGSSVPKLTNYL